MSLSDKFPGRFNLRPLVGHSYTPVIARTREELNAAIELALGDRPFESIDERNRVIVDGKPAMWIEHAGVYNGFLEPHPAPAAGRFEPVGEPTAPVPPKPLKAHHIPKEPLKRPGFMKPVARRSALRKATKNRKS